MRRIILFNMMTLEGYFEGVDQRIDWHHVDEEFNNFSGDQINGVDEIYSDGKRMTSWKVIGTLPVSYTHLDVYKRQGWLRE